MNSFDRAIQSDKITKAIRSNDLSYIRINIDYIKGDCYESKCNTYLYEAIKAGNPDTLAILLDIGSIISNFRISGHNDHGSFSYTGFTLQDIINNNLITASRCKQLECVKFLLERGADPKAYDSQVLRETVQRGNPEILKFLIEIGNYTTSDIRRALSVAFCYIKNNKNKVIMLEACSDRDISPELELIREANGYCDRNNTTLILLHYYCKSKDRLQTFMDIIKEYQKMYKYIEKYMKAVRLIQRFVKNYLYKPIYKDGSRGIMVTKQLKNN